MDERGNWFNSSQLLKKIVRNHGVRSIRVLYDRELDKAVGGEKKREGEGHAGSGRKFDNNRINKSPGKSERVKTVMKEELQDLDAG